MICLGYVLFSPAYLAQDHCLPIISLPSSLPFWTCSSHPSLEHDHLTHFFLPLFLQVIAVQCHPTMAVSHTIASSAGATLQLTCFTYCRNKVKGTERNCRVRATGKVRTEKKKQRGVTGTWKSGLPRWEMGGTRHCLPGPQPTMFLILAHAQHSHNYGEVRQYFTSGWG